MSRGIIWDPKLKECILNDYFSGNKSAAELSEMTGVPKKTITQWAWLKQKENKEKGIEAPKRITKHKCGAPKGNKNAVGSKGPTGQQNAKKHGAYASVILGALDPEEQELIESLPDSSEEHLKEEIKILTMRERRILKAIEKYSNEELYIRSRTVKTRSRIPDEPEEENPQNEEAEQTDLIDPDKGIVSTTEWSCMELVIRLEHELTTIQIAIRENLVALERIRKPAVEVSTLQLMRKKLQIELLDARIEHLDARTAGMLDRWNIVDLSETDALIYGSGNETV